MSRHPKSRRERVRSKTQNVFRSQAEREKAVAHRDLDRAIAGHGISEERITWALRITGDLT